MARLPPGEGPIAPSRPDPAEAAEEFGPSPALLVGTIVVAKIATIAIVLWLCWTPQAGLFVAVSSWYWLLVIAALGIGPALLALRLRRARRRRLALQRAEWMLGPAAPERTRARASWPKRSAGVAAR